MGGIFRFNIGNVRIMGNWKTQIFTIVLHQKAATKVRFYYTLKF